MRIKNGLLMFVESKNPPVFDETVDITYTIEPEKGQSFLFNSKGNGCNLSIIQQIKTIGKASLIKTLNSTYLLYRKENS